MGLPRSVSTNIAAQTVLVCNQLNDFYCLESNLNLKCLKGSGTYGTANGQKPYCPQR